MLFSCRPSLTPFTLTLDMTSKRHGVQRRNFAMAEVASVCEDGSNSPWSASLTGDLKHTHQHQHGRSHHHTAGRVRTPSTGLCRICYTFQSCQVALGVKSRFNQFRINGEQERRHDTYSYCQVPGFYHDRPAIRHQLYLKLQ